VLVPAEQALKLGCCSAVNWVEVSETGMRELGAVDIVLFDAFRKSHGALPSFEEVDVEGGCGGRVAPLVLFGFSLGVGEFYEIGVKPTQFESREIGIEDGEGGALCEIFSSGEPILDFIVSSGAS